jgi:hypothetical protein
MSVMMRGMTSGCDGNAHLVPVLKVTGKQAIRLRSLNQLNIKSNALVTGNQGSHTLLSLITTGAILAPF